MRPAAVLALVVAAAPVRAADCPPPGATPAAEVAADWDRLFDEAAP